METGNVPNWSKNISVSIGLENVMDHYGADQKAIRYNGNIVLNNNSHVILNDVEPINFL